MFACVTSSRLQHAHRPLLAISGNIRVAGPNPTIDGSLHYAFTIGQFLGRHDINTYLVWLSVAALGWIGYIKLPVYISVYAWLAT